MFQSRSGIRRSESGVFDIEGIVLTSADFLTYSFRAAPLSFTPSHVPRTSLAVLTLHHNHHATIILKSSISHWERGLL